MLRVTIYSQQNADVEDVYEVDYVSLVNSETFGPPPLVAPQRGERPLAQVGDNVLYINTNLVPLFQIERVTD